MVMNEDADLLEQFAATRSETAFAELVRRHVDLVHSAALRQFGGDAARAEDVTQAVFIELSRQAARLARHPLLTGWLCTTTYHLASRAARAEQRRAGREKSFHMHQSADSPASPEPALEAAIWHDLQPVLDAALQELSDRDREAILLRFFRHASLAQVGAAIGASENAARMRVDRALDKLRAVLEKRGIRCASSVLGAALAANAVTLAPAGLAAALTGPAVAAGLAGAGGAIGVAGLGLAPLLGFMTSAKIKIGLAGLAAAAAGAGYLITTQQARLGDAEAALRASQARIAALRAEPSPPPAPLAATADAASFRSQQSELLKLRDEVTRLRAENKAMLAAAAARPDKPSSSPTPEQQAELNRTLGLAKLNFAGTWAAAFYQYAEAHDGLFPKSFAEAAEFLPELTAEASQLISLTGPPDYEILFQGKLADLANPATAIVMREKEPFNHQPDGSAQRTYLFADGHAEIHRAPQGNFEPFETKRQPKFKTQPESALKTE